MLKEIKKWSDFDDTLKGFVFSYLCCHLENTHCTKQQINIMHNHFIDSQKGCILMSTALQMAKLTYSAYHVGNSSAISKVSARATASASSALSQLPNTSNLYGAFNPASLEGLKGNSASSLKDYKSAKAEFNTAYEKAMDGLSTATNRLKDANYQVQGATEDETAANVSEVVSSVKSFVANFNDTIDLFSTYSDHSSRANAMTSLFKTSSFQSDQLSGIGITTDGKGKLTVNETAFTAALKNDGNTVARVLTDKHIGLAAKTEDKISFARTQQDKIFPTAEQLLTNKSNTSYSRLGLSTSLSTYSNVGNLLHMMF